MPLTPSRVVGLALSKEANPLLLRLKQAGLLTEIRWPDDPISPADWLAREWPLASAVVAVAAVGLVTRLVAPLLASKHTDPAIGVGAPACCTTWWTGRDHWQQLGLGAIVPR